MRAAYAHRTRGYTFRLCSPTCFTASPTISTSFVSASRKSSSESRSPRDRPRPNSIAFWAASIMCRTRTSSGRVIKGLGRRPHFVAEEPAQVLIGPELDVPVAKQPAEFQLHGREPEETRCAARLELDEKVDVAVGALLASADGAEERESVDATAATESGQSLFVEIQHRAHAPILPSASKASGRLGHPTTGSAAPRQAGAVDSPVRCGGRRAHAVLTHSRPPGDTRCHDGRPGPRQNPWSRPMGCARCHRMTRAR